MFRVAVALLVLLAISAQAEERRLETVAGVLRISKAEGSAECVIDLAGDTVARIDCEAAYLPNVIANFQNVGNLKQVLVLEESPMGNACNGGPLHVVSITRDRRVRASESLEFCGGVDPQVVRRGNAILITFPGGPPNRGEGRIPTERWRFSEGTLEKQR